MAAIHPGTRLGRYEVHEYLGPGTFGAVHRAYEPALGTVTIEVLTELASEARPELRDLEPRLIALRHTNLASVLDAGDHDGVPFLVMQDAPGGSLARRLVTSLPDRQASLRLLHGIAEGLDHAHRSGFVHGGLRPERVLLTADERPLVAEVGLEDLRRPPGSLPSDLTAERAAYLAPEQAAGSPATAASDRCALAALAYRLLTGRVPFTGGTCDVLQERMYSQAPLPSTQGPGLGQATDRVLMQGLAGEPSARWHTGVQMVTALREALEEDARPPEEPAPAERRWMPWALGAAAVLLVIALIGILLVWRLNQAPTPSVNLSSTVVEAGSTVTVSASHLPANQVGSIELASAQRSIGAFQADRYGNAQQDVRVPADTEVGGHVLSLCWQGQCPASAKLSVSAAPPSPTPTGTPPPTPTPEPTPVRPPEPTAPPTRAQTSPPATPATAGTPSGQP